jgi:hypothetical protein
MTKLSSVIFVALTACASVGQGDSPELVYQKYHSAIRAKDFAQYERLSANAARAKLERKTAEERKFMMEMISQFVPLTYTILQTAVDTSGNIAELRVEGSTTVGDKEMMLEGLIRLVKEEAGWKIDRPDSWTIKSERPAGRAN